MPADPCYRRTSLRHHRVQADIPTPLQLGSKYTPRRQPVLQLDQLILFLLQPGFHQEPDHRCMERLITAARQADNPYRVVFPVQALTILDNARGNTLHACVVSWWVYNGRTEFFASGYEARMVRCALKKECLPAPGGL